MECAAEECAANFNGVAQMAWKRLSPEVKADYEAAREALEKRFEPENKRSLYFVEFQFRGRKKEETWSDFTDELRVLADNSRRFLKLRTKQRNCSLLSVFSVSLLIPRLPSRFDRGSLKHSRMKRKSRRGTMLPSKEKLHQPVCRLHGTLSGIDVLQISMVVSTPGETTSFKRGELKCYD